MFDELTAIKHSKATETLIRFWLGLPRPEGKVCPRRKDFTAMQIAPNLPEIFLSEWQSPDRLVILQAGTTLDRLVGEDITGKSVFEVIPERLVPGEREYYQLLRDQPCAGMVSRSTPNLDDRPIIYRTIQLPLLDERGEVRYFVGTGYEVPKETIDADEVATDREHSHHIERRFFDIGAGVPTLESQYP